jgi:hypothetical protein
MSSACVVPNVTLRDGNATAVSEQCRRYGSLGTDRVRQCRASTLTHNRPLCGLRAKVIEDYSHMMPAYDPNVCDDVCWLFLSCREIAGEKAELKGLIAGCGGQAFEHLPTACLPDPAPWCGSPAITGQARAGRWRRRPRPFLMVAGLPALFVCGRLRVTGSRAGRLPRRPGHRCRSARTRAGACPSRGAHQRSRRS